MRYKFHSIILLLLLSCVSCSKNFLDEKPQDFISPDNYLTNEAQSKILLSGVYASLDFIGTTNENQKMFPLQLETTTDDVYDSQPWHNTTEWARGQGNSNSPWAKWKWDLDFQGISRANVFLDGMAKATFQSPDISRYIAEAKFLRAWFYHDLATYYGGVPLILVPGDLSNSFPARNSKEEIITQVLKDLDEAIPDLPAQYTADEDQGRVTKGAALGLKARVLLYNEKWEQAAAAAQAVMDLKVYNLFPDYQGLFLEKNEAGARQEIMFQVYYTPDIMPSFVYYPIGVYPAFAPTLQFVNAYYMKNGLPITDPQSGFDPENPYMSRDPRLKASIFYPGSKYINFIIGAPDPSVSTDSMTIPAWLLNESGFRAKKNFDGTLMNVEKEGHNKYFMRYGEILLTYAEAINEAQGPQHAYDAIDQLRRRAGMATLSEAMPGLTKEQMRNVIRNERRVELAFEGVRWADIRRWKIAEQVMIDALGYDNTKLKTYPGDGLGTSPNWQYEPIIIDKRSFNTGRDYLWPIPQSEINANPNMVQNPGYN
ncbi:MAG: RagB/SusD family nutrient uptake outer membrane protein [Agriterribacter sp.]